VVFFVFFLFFLCWCFFVVCFFFFFLVWFIAPFRTEERGFPCLAVLPDVRAVSAGKEKKKGNPFQLQSPERGERKKKDEEEKSLPQKGEKEKGKKTATRNISGKSGRHHSDRRGEGGRRPTGTNRHVVGEREGGEKDRGGSHPGSL